MAMDWHFAELQAYSWYFILWQICLCLFKEPPIKCHQVSLGGRLWELSAECNLECWITARCYFISSFWLFFPTRCWNLGKGTWFWVWPSLYQQDYICTRCLMVRALHARLPCYCCILIPADIKDFVYKPFWRCVLLNTLPAQTHVELFKLFISLLLMEMNDFEALLWDLWCEMQ